MALSLCRFHLAVSGCSMLLRNSNTLYYHTASLLVCRFALLPQMRLRFWGVDDAASATLPIALLTSIVRKEALLPEHTAVFAATQLLPVIQTAIKRHLAGTPDKQYYLCMELLVSAHLPRCRHISSMTATWTSAIELPSALQRCACFVCKQEMHTVYPAVQTMCSYLATSSAWPVLLGHRDLIMLAADMLLSHCINGPSPSSPCSHPSAVRPAWCPHCLHATPLLTGLRSHPNTPPA